MEFFDDDSFEDIIKEFFGENLSGKNRKKDFIIKGEKEDRNIDFIEEEDYVYIIFEFPGYSEKNISIFIKGNQLEIKARKNKKICETEEIQPYLNQKLCQGIYIKKTLPKFINSKKFEHTMKNGVLEIKFSKK